MSKRREPRLSVEDGCENSSCTCCTERLSAVNGQHAAPSITELLPPLSFPVTCPRKTGLTTYT